MGDKVLLQVYFYKTYLYQQSVKKALKYRTTKSTGGKSVNSGAKRYAKSFDWFYMYSPELFSLMSKLKALGPSKTETSGVRMKSRKGGRKGVTFKRRAWKKLNRAVRPQHSVVMYNNFFTYFFLHFFKMPSLVLAKSLYKAVISNGLFKHEHRVLLHRTRFLKWYQ